MNKKPSNISNLSVSNENILSQTNTIRCNELNEPGLNSVNSMITIENTNMKNNNIILGSNILGKNKLNQNNEQNNEHNQISNPNDNLNNNNINNNINMNKSENRYNDKSNHEYKDQSVNNKNNTHQSNQYIKNNNSSKLNLQSQDKLNFSLNSNTLLIHKSTDSVVQNDAINRRLENLQKVKVKDSKDLTKNDRLDTENIDPKSNMSVDHSSDPNITLDKSNNKLPELNLEELDRRDDNTFDTFAKNTKYQKSFIQSTKSNKLNKSVD